MQYVRKSHDILAFDAIIRIEIRRHKNLNQAKQTLLTLHKEFAPKVKYLHRTYKGNIAPPPDSVWVNYIEMALENLGLGKALYDQSYIKRKLKEKRPY